MPIQSLNSKTQKVSYLPDPLSFFVAGFQYSDGAKGFDLKGETSLIHEPDNRYDKDALAVYVGGTKVGYAPRPLNSFLLYFIAECTFVSWELTNYSVTTARKHTEIQITMKP